MPHSTHWSLDRMPPQVGARVVITGGAGGIGFETAKVFARAGATVLIAARDADKAGAAQAAIASAIPGAKVDIDLLDLAELASIHAFADALSRRDEPIDLLINCAGVMAIPTRQLTVDGFEKHVGTNHLGHFALTGLLLPLIGAGGPARVITVSSQSARGARLDLDDLQSVRDYRPMAAYGVSKLANILFGVELNAHVGAAPVLSLPVHPGTARTGIQQYGTNPVSAWIGRRIMDLVGQPLNRVAEPLAFAAVTPDAQPGSYISRRARSNSAVHPDSSNYRLPPRTRLCGQPSGRNPSG